MESLVRRAPIDGRTMPESRIARLRKLRDDTGSATAEYAIATLAAVGFAGLLVVILRSDAVRAMLTNLIQHALSYTG
jgi:Flp pilus assembly pilin Flp